MLEQSQDLLVDHMQKIRMERMDRNLNSAVKDDFNNQMLETEDE